MKRADALRAIRFAGYHEDRATATRIYGTHRISIATLQQEFRAGAAMRRAGMACGCGECAAAEESGR